MLNKKVILSVAVGIIIAGVFAFGAFTIYKINKSLTETRNALAQVVGFINQQIAASQGQVTPPATPEQ